jgi:hypothetical protein
MRHILILVHRHDAFDKDRYVLREIVEVWREWGWRVSIAQGPGERVAADVVICHVDLTVTPADYRAFAESYPMVLNGRVTDISKHIISRNVVRRGDGYDGPVIVKTRRNSGGSRERRLQNRVGRVRRRLRALRERFPWSWQSHLPTHAYPVFDAPRDVPRVAWYNPALIVERFLPERSDGQYCLRTWVFLGDRETNAISYANEPIIKSHNIVRREPVPDVPEELRRIRCELGFDYGKFDYGIVDGRVVLYDVNRTPTFGKIPREQYWPRVQMLAEGIRAFVGAR